MTSARALWLALGAAVLAAVVALTLALSGHDPAPAASAKSHLQLIGGKPLQQASCAAWLTATPDERVAVIAALKRTVGGSTPYGPGTTLNSADAYALFERSCTRPYARGFLLYIIYSRAAAFQNTPQHFQ